MKATHRFNSADPFPVTAWQFSRTEPIPVWVARKFHRLGDGDEWTSLAMDGALVKARPGDWAVSFYGAAVVLTNGEFERHFQKIEEGAGVVS